jgi:hypothetical protein
MDTIFRPLEGIRGRADQEMCRMVELNTLCGNGKALDSPFEVLFSGRVGSTVL